MADKQESIELGEVRTKDTTNQDEAALARLGKKSVLKVRTSHLHAQLLKTFRSDDICLARGNLASSPFWDLAAPFS